MARAAAPKPPAPALCCHVPAVPGQRTAVFIRGYWTGTVRDEIRAKAYVDALHACGWRGGIYQYRWDAGHFSAVLGPVLLKLSARFGYALLTRMLRAPVGRSVLIPTEVADFYHDWVRTYVRAQELGEKALIPALQGELDGASLTLFGHSLGGRLAYFALRAAAATDYRFENAVILGGAHPRHDAGWADAAGGVNGHILNVYHGGDAVLKYLYRLGTGTTRSPCGLKPVRPVHRGLRNVDAAHCLDAYRNSHNRYTDHLPALLGGKACAYLLGDEDSL